MSVAVLWVYFQFGSSMLITMFSFLVTYRGSTAQWLTICARGAVQFKARGWKKISRANMSPV